MRSWQKDIHLNLKAEIFELVRLGRPSIERAAARLGVSVRSLQRHLHIQGLQYSSLVDAMRFDAARSLLLDPSLDIAGVASRLGYRDPSSFSRAFMRWSGQSPRRWRRSQRVSRPSSE